MTNSAFQTLTVSNQFRLHSASLGPSLRTHCPDKLNQRLILSLAREKNLLLTGLKYTEQPPASLITSSGATWSVQRHKVLPRDGGSHLLQESKQLSVATASRPCPLFTWRSKVHPTHAASQATEVKVLTCR